MSQGQRILFLFIMFFSSISAMSCAAIFNGKTEAVKFTSNPPGAEVLVDNVPVGKTPVELQIQAREDHKVILRKEGYSDSGAMISTGVGAGWVILDVLCALIPIIIDAATSAWYDLSPNEIDLTLQPLAQPSK